jgi:hypothetical protein
VAIEAVTAWPSVSAMFRANHRVRVRRAMTGSRDSNFGVGAFEDAPPNDLDAYAAGASFDTPRRAPSGIDASRAARAVAPAETAHRYGLGAQQ